jgi:hypothetical protein
MHRREGAHLLAFIKYNIELGNNIIELVEDAETI